MADNHRISEAQAAYRGRWVAEIQGKIVGQGGTREQALQAAKAARRKESPSVTYVPMQNTLQFSPVIDRIRELIPEDVALYLVGGAVRDALLQKPCYDLDFCTSADAIRLARRIANKMKGAYYKLDDEHGAGRVVLRGPQTGRLILDFTPFRGVSLEEDLEGRDFTINAIAVDIRKPEEILDPLGGGADLASGRIKACSPRSLADDPVRSIRAVRFASSLNFRIEAETLQWIKAAVPGLVQVSIERQRDEFFKILKTPDPTTPVRILQRIGVLEYIFPEISPMIGFPQILPHVYDVWEHSLHTFSAVNELMGVLDREHDEARSSQMNLGLVVLHLGRYRTQITELLEQVYVQDRSLRSLLLLAAMLHDIGKPVTYQDSGDYADMFPNHDIAGAEIIEQLGQRLHLSRKEMRFLSGLVENHLAVSRLTHMEGKLSRKQLYQFFRRVGDLSAPLILLTLADQFGVYGTSLPQAKLIRYLEVCRQILEALWETEINEFDPDLLLSGQDIMDQYDLEPGPQIGQLLEILREAQVVEGIDTRAKAYAYLRKYVVE